MSAGGQNVIEFPQRFTQREVWECGCGHRRFVLVEGGEVACGQCDAMQPWRYFDPLEVSNT